MSSADKQKAISGSSSSAGWKRIRLDESATSEKTDIEMPAAHNKVKIFRAKLCILNLIYRISKRSRLGT